MSFFNFTNDNILRIEDVMARTGLSRSMIYKLQSAQEFPKSISLGERAVGWSQADVDIWISKKRGRRTASRDLPIIYMAGKMGEPFDNKQPGHSFSCWRIFNVAESMKSGELEMDRGDNDVLIAEPELMTFHGTNVNFLYSGPWKARGSYHGYRHGITTCSPEWAEGAAYRGAIQGITRADIFVAFLEDLTAFGTLVEIGYARAQNKKIIVVTPYGSGDYGRSELQNDLWFALRAADKHIVLPNKRFESNEEKWSHAHGAVAAVVSEWYPATAL
ncbi:AlpA family phage regulatory protein [Janthinobacterium sp. FW305-128]|uniref:AlpA family phage regulatory protein n=1 Tax=Janthinobacterium sp. FW305-128 TaxID=2775055 RepID=UPI001E3FCD54|nr:AlpA family phage regulatory protein [Janthinobacterium sp. FW305-128]MCC7681081.1 AlpA family phage regulatory protein [Janthinobacterium sp. FW305-128]